MPKNKLVSHEVSSIDSNLEQDVDPSITGGKLPVANQEAATSLNAAAAQLATVGGITYRQALAALNEIGRAHV